MEKFLRKLGTAAWDAVRDKTDENNLRRARMTADEAEAAARIAAEEAGLGGLDLGPPELTTSDDNERLIWRLHLSVRGEDPAYIGKHNWIVVEDDTGTVSVPEE